jgi:hypothetical protein
MSDQSNQALQSALTPEELRQHLLDQLSAEQKVIAELSDEELNVVTGGVSSSGHIPEFIEFGSPHSSLDVHNGHSTPLSSTPPGSQQQSVAGSEHNGAGALDKLKSHVVENRLVYERAGSNILIGGAVGFMAGENIHH